MLLAATLLPLRPIDSPAAGRQPEVARRAPADSLVIDLRLVRTDGGDGDALVSSGIPLPEGALSARELDRTRVVVNGIAQPAYVEALHGTYRDGSLRSVLIQFHTTIPGRGTASARLEIGPHSHGAASPRGRADSPSAVALPASADYLVATGIVGPTITTRRSSTIGDVFREYEQKAADFSNDHWQRDNSAWAAANYYDRALGHYALWARTASPAYWRRATAIAVDYRTHYLEHARFSSSPHWAQLEGVAVHYWLTGDERSRVAVIETARKLSAGFPAARGARSDYQYNEGRIQQRVMLACLLAWSLGDSSRDWGAMADAYVENWLRLQRPDGSFRYRLNTEDDQSPLGQSNFMEGLRMDALAKYYDLRRADPRIVGAIRRQVDFLWSSQWLPAAQAFRYWSVARVDAAPDLNMLMVLGFGFVYHTTGIERYRQWGDEIFAAGVSKTYYKGSKQYNEQQYDSFNYLGYRQLPPGTQPVSPGSG